jgi:hypothetical protein
MSTTPVVRYLPIKPTGYWEKLYEIHVDGEKAGFVGTKEVAHERAPRGSRIVTRRTYSARWFVTPDLTRRDRIPFETRKDAVARFLRDRNDKLPQHEQIDRRAVDLAVDDGRNYKKSEIEHLDS